MNDDTKRTLGRYVAGGGIILGLLTVIGNDVMDTVDHAETQAATAVEVAGDASHKADEVDQRQRWLERLYDEQRDINRELLNIQRHDRGLPPLPTPTGKANAG